jgi:hypothetical protein
MDVGKSTSSLGKVSILYSIQKLVMTRTSDHVSWTGSIPNSSIEGMPWGDGCMDLLNFKNSLEGLGGKDLDLNMPHGFRAFIRHLSPVIPQLLLVSQLLQYLPEHLGDPASITSVMLELANISVWKSSR